MRLTQTLWHQHIGFMFRKHWKVQGVRIPIETGAEETLKAKGIPVIDANEYVKYKHEKTNIQIIGCRDKPVIFDERHPNWNEKVCHIIKNQNVLLEGLEQAKILTKTVELAEGLPASLEHSAQDRVPVHVHDQVRRAILSACVFDSTQEKMPIYRNPERPYHNLPRILGITDVKQNIILTNKLLTILERNANEISKERAAIFDAESVASVEKDDDRLQFRQVSNLLLTSRNPLQPALSDTSSLENMNIPDLSPIKCTISMNKENFYKMENVYPLKKSTGAFHPHTSFLHFNKTTVTNLYETNVLEKQIMGRALLHAFTVATSYAKTLYEKDIDVLPKPVTLQCVQFSGNNMYFGVLQLNTLNLNGNDGIKNVWYTTPAMPMFESCSYKQAQPTLTGYNPEAFNYLRAFYVNQ